MIKMSLDETERTLDNITHLLYEANKPADSLLAKFGNVTSESKKMQVIMRFLSGTGAWRFLNKVKALGMMVQGYYENLESANQELRDSVKLYAEQIHHLENIADLYEEGTNQLDMQKVRQSDLYKGLESMYGDAYANLKIQEMTDEAFANQFDKLEKIKRSNMQNADILKAIQLQQESGISASPELLAEARKRGLGQTMDGTDTAKFQEFGPIKKFFSMRWRKLVNAGISVGGLIKNLGKIAIDYVKAGAKIFMMSLLYISMFLFLLILAKPFIVRMMDAAKDLRKSGSETLRFLGIFWTNFKERFAVVFKAASNFIKVLFDKEKGFKETLAAYFQLVFAVFKMIAGTLLDLLPVIISFALETLVVLVNALGKLLYDGLHFLLTNSGKILGFLYSKAKVFLANLLTKVVTALKENTMGALKTIAATAAGGVIGFALGGPVGAAAGASIGYGLAGGLATGGIVGRSGNYLIGEKGPEILSLPRGAKVTPNHQIRNTGGNTIHVHVSGRVGASDQEIRDIARKVGAQVSREINRTTSSGMRA